MSETLTSKTLHGIKWSYLSSVINTVLQIGFTAIMARLLEPPVFGLVAMAGVVLRFGSYFSQMGVGRALIQKKEISKEDIRAAFTSSLTLGSAFFGLAWISAPLATYIFKNAEVIPIIRIMALSFVLSGVSATALSLLRRDLEFRSLAIIGIVSYVIGHGGVGVTLAYSGFGVWSLVIGALSQSTILAVLSYLFSRHTLAFIYRWKYYKQLYSFGSRVSFISFWEFLGSNLDTFAIGHFLGAAPLGIYNRAFMLVNLPMQNLVTSFSNVLFPSFSRIQTEIQRLKKAYLSSIMLASALLIPTCIGIAAASREIVLLVLGEKWIAAIPALQILAIATPFNLLAHFGGIVCEATATLNIKIFIQIAHVILLGILFYVMSSFGIIGFAIAVVVGEFARHTAYIFVVKRMLKIKIREMATVYIPALVSGLIIGVSIYLAASFMRQAEWPVLLVFAVELIIGLTLLLSLLLFGPQHAVREEIQERLSHAGVVTNRNTIAGRAVNWLEKKLLVN